MQPTILDSGGTSGSGPGSSGSPSSTPGEGESTGGSSSGGSTGTTGGPIVTYPTNILVNGGFELGLECYVD
ncbi:MAG: hypothetical protein ACYDCL_00505 [Myxococcales bacterium]